MRHNLNLNWLRSFESAARLLNFTAASVELGLTQAAVSQHIRALEARLGDQLFIRRAKSLQLTDMGKAYLSNVREALNTIDMSTTGLFGPRQASTITVRASMALTIWLAPRLGGFLRASPDIGVKLVTAIWTAPDDQQPVDVDVILAPNERATTGLELLGEEAIVPLCSTAVADQIKTLPDLLRFDPIHIIGFDDHWARYLAAHSQAADMSGTRLMADTSTAAMEMVAANLGCAIVIERFARAVAEVRPDICIVGKPVPLGQSHFLTPMQSGILEKPGVEAFRAWLREQFNPSCS